ncbi:MAG: hypothetical protein BGO98_41145 [Myxococcales bacterium 68-20]|nr:hypothetical protein [Myxococcales bacterium]OJY27673.1 MAG: hypothetical protein BGO98_41145 [Myxococcales bacterium 68-20]
MLLTTAVIPRTDLVSLVESITPLCVTIDKERNRTISLGRPKVELVAGRGLRLRGDAHVHWDFAHVPIPVTINTWQLVLVPRVSSRGRSHVLSFAPDLEELDVKLVPGFVDEKIANAIRDAISHHRDRLAWDFGRTLSKRLPLPANVSPSNTFEIFPVGGDVSVGEAEIRLALRFETRFEPRAAEAESDAAQKRAPALQETTARASGH